MTHGLVIAVLGGARETVRAVEWLARAGAQGFVIWGAGTEPERTAFADGYVSDLARADAIVDVTHAFDEVTRSSAISKAPGLPYARIGRAVWAPSPQDNWTELNTLIEAVAALPSGTRVFAATGRGSLGALADHDGPVFLRQLTRHALPMPLAHGQFVFGSAPFSVADEVALLRDLRIDVVLARNIGGMGSFPKLAAARHLRLPVVLLRPPEMPAGPQLASFTDVKSWIAGL